MSKDKPFRELQFSSVQLIVVFLAILVLGVFIFLLGISVGKKQAQLAVGAAVPAKTETAAPKTPVSADAAAAAKPEVAKLQDKPLGKPADKPADKLAVKPGEPGGVGSAAKPQGRFYVQIGAGGDKPAAMAFGEKVELLGFPSHVLDPLATDRKTVFRVRIGPYETSAAADDAQAKVAAALKKKKTDFFIVVD
jgi:cell division protein FtsN